MADPKSARSDDLVELREVMRAASEYLGTDSVGPPAVLNFIVDANVVLQHLGFLVGGRRNQAARSSLQEVADAGVARFFGPFWLAHEIERKIPEFAAMRGLPTASLRTAWTGYSQQLHLFRADPVAGVDVVDPKDLPYAYAQRIIGADAVITEDPHLLKSNVPTLLTKLTHRELRDWARRRAVSDSIAAMGYGTTLAGVGLVRSAAKGIVQAVGKRPLVGGLLLAGAGGLLWWWDSKRQAETGTSPTGEVLRALGAVVNDLADAYRAADGEASANMDLIRTQIGQTSRGLVEWLLTACIVARQPVAEPALIGCILDDGFRRPEVDPSAGASQNRRRLRDSQFAHDVGHTLRTDGRFTWTGTGWTTTLLRPQRNAASAETDGSTLATARRSRPTATNSRNRQSLSNQSMPARHSGRRPRSTGDRSRPLSRNSTGGKKTRRRRLQRAGK